MYVSNKSGKSNWRRFLDRDRLPSVIAQFVLVHLFTTSRYFFASFSTSNGIKNRGIV